MRTWAFLFDEYGPCSNWSLFDEGEVMKLPNGSAVITGKPLNWPCGCEGTKDGKKITISKMCWFAGSKVKVVKQ